MGEMGRQYAHVQMSGVLPADLGQDLGFIVRLK